jgi:regulator of replication initiation timing
MKERINAFWNKHFGAELFPADGTDVAIEETHVEGLEAMGTKLEELEAENTQLKEENQTHAERLAELEAVELTASADAALIIEALEANNVELAEGQSIAELAAEKINAWGKTVPDATPVASTSDTDVDDAPNGETFLTEIDRRAIEKHKRKNKK